jgi:hypothetical protein
MVSLTPSLTLPFQGEGESGDEGSGASGTEHSKRLKATLISRHCPEKGQNSDVFGHNPA